MIYDISRRLAVDTVVWPGDAPVELTKNASISAGESVNLGSISLSLHSGAHIDAPFHYSSDGATIDKLTLEPFVGPAHVLHIPNKETITVADVLYLNFAVAKRLIIRTDRWKEGESFPAKIPLVSHELIKYLGEAGVLLLGVDVPSVDQITSKDLPNHNALGAWGIQILESLNLVGVPEGIYELIALPLKIIGADGSPVRAILRAL